MNIRHRNKNENLKPAQAVNTPRRLSILSSAVLVALVGASPAFAAPLLGAALASFAVLGATGVTNVATSTIGGNLGSSPTPAPLGDGSITEGYVFTAGSLQANTALAQQAQLDLDAAITTLNLMANTGGTLAADLTLSGPLAPGVYDVLAGTTNLSGALILDGTGPSDNVWVFRFADTFVMSEGSNVSVINVGDSSDVGVYWSVGSAATVDGDTLVGNVFANTLISSNGNLTLGCGRLASATAQVTLIKDTISIGCASGGSDQGNTNTGVPGAPVPEPGTLLLAGLGLAGLFAARKRRVAVA